MKPIIRLRGIRQVIPSGYVMGRVSPGAGDAELIPISLFAAKSVATGVVASGGSAAYIDAGLFLAGNSNAVAQLYQFQYFVFAPAPAPLSFPSLFVTPTAICQVPPAGATAIIHITSDVTDFHDNGVSGTKTIGTFTFAASATTATYVAHNAVTIARGATLYAVLDINWFETAIAYINIVVPGDFNG